MKSIYRRIPVILLTCVSLFILAGCGQNETKADQAPLVKTSVVGNHDVNATANSFAGIIKNRNETPLSFQTGGRVIAKYVEIGSSVQAGQVLAEINQSDMADQITKAEGSVSAAQAQYDLASTNYQRYQQLYDQEAISRLQLDQAEQAYKVAEAQLSQAKASLSTSQNQFTYTRIIAPSDGTITASSLEVGQVVGAGQVVATLAVGHEPEAVIALPEQELGHIKVGSQAEVGFWALPDIRTPAVVREISPIPDPATRTYTVKLSLPNPPEALRLGMTATVYFTDQVKPSFTIPLTALVKTETGNAVYVIKDGTAVLTPITTGKFDANSIEVLKGLEKGDRIITAGTNKLKTGMKVRV